MLKPIGRYILNHSRAANAARLNLQMLPTVLMGRRRRAKRSWSQHHEDEHLVAMLRDSFDNGYYVDIGANHPSQISNTYRLYNLGMRGICVEPNEVLCALHQRYRPGDLIVNAGIGESNGLAKFYEFTYHGISTFSESEAKRRQELGAKLTRVSVRPMLRLETILEQCAPPDRPKFELLSVDTEGWDEVVLRSNNWNRFRPRLVIVETNSEEEAQELAGVMREFEYEKKDTYGVNQLYHDIRHR